MSSAIEVKSEIGALRKVVVHAPGPEWDLVPCGPKVLERFLIEDIFVLREARREHDHLTRILRLFLGDENVLEFETLLEEVCSDVINKRELVSAIAVLDSLGLDTTQNLLSSDLDSRGLARALIRGAIVDVGDKGSYKNLFKPIPNLLFTRDLGAAIPGGFIICYARKEARQRETLLMRYVLRANQFEGTTIFDIRELQSELFWHDIGGGEPVCIEGGDVVVLNESTVMVGTGERTTEAGLGFLLDQLRAKHSSVGTIVRAILPEVRETMHLDTVFTVISNEEFMLHRPVIDECEFIIYQDPYEKENASRPLSFEEALKEVGLHHMDKIQCGGESELFQGREQWTDGANLFAIASGLTIGYDRNQETRKVLEQRGYRYLEAANGNDTEEIESIARAFRRV